MHVLVDEIRLTGSANMPKERKKRGKYEEQRRLREAKRMARGEPAGPAKRRKLQHGKPQDEDPEDLVVSGNAGDDFISFGTQPPQPLFEPQFHGLLDPEEQEYYGNVNTKITAKDFESPEDLIIFIEAVYRESEGKELKLASSQSCSRYLEKLIILSTEAQLQSLFAKFLGSLTYLVQHRFGSHCCETLFLQAAKKIKIKRDDSDDRKESKGLEKLFIQAAEELEPNMGFLLTERFASHSVRVLFLVLSGEPLENAATKSLLASKKKETLETPSTTETKATTSQRSVPKRFKKALNRLISAAISTLDTTYLRALATHPTGNPVLQLLLRLELSTSDKGRLLDEKSLFRKLMPDESVEADNDSGKFVSGLLFDPTGSHLIEVLVQHTSGKTFKMLYKNIWRDRMGSMAKNDIASYVAIRILERLGKDDLAEAQSQLLPELPILVERRRTGLIKALVDRCVVREVGLQPLAAAIESAYGGDKSSLLVKMLAIPKVSEARNGQQGSLDKTAEKRWATSDVHGSLLAQSMLEAPEVCGLVQDSLLALDTESLTLICGDSIASRVVQHALKSSTATVGFRKQMIPKFYDRMMDLAQSPAGSYVADTLWEATSGLHFMKERLARELASNESDLRGSSYGRTVWRNWSMDLYQRKRAEWQALARGYTNEDKQASQDQKSGLELARLRYAQQKSKGD